MISRENGKNISELEHIKQSIQDILTTPIGSRVMRREYGSLLPRLIDAPLNEATILQVQSAAATAILRWENRIAIERINAQQLSNGQFHFELEVQRSNSHNAESLQIPVKIGGA